MYAALSSNSKLWWKGDVSETAAGSSCRMPLKKNLFFVLTFYQCMSMMQNYSNPFCFIHHPPLALMKAVYDFSLRPLGVDIMDVGVWVWVGGGWKSTHASSTQVHLEAFLTDLSSELRPGEEEEEEAFILPPSEVLSICVWKSESPWSSPAKQINLHPLEKQEWTTGEPE